MRKPLGLSHYRRGVAQLVARTAGGREVAGSSPVTPTKLIKESLLDFAGSN